MSSLDSKLSLSLDEMAQRRALEAKKAKQAAAAKRAEEQKRLQQQRAKAEAAAAAKARAQAERASQAARAAQAQQAAANAAAKARAAAGAQAARTNAARRTPEGAGAGKMRPGRVGPTEGASTIKVTTELRSRSSLQAQASQRSRAAPYSRPTEKVIVKEKVAPPKSGSKLIVRNLDAGVTLQDVKELFGAVGAVRQATLTTMDNSTNLMAEVTFVERAKAEAARTQYNGIKLDGRAMDIRLVEEPTSATTSTAGPGKASVKARLGVPSPRPTVTVVSKAPAVQSRVGVSNFGRAPPSVPSSSSSSFSRRDVEFVVRL